MLSRKRIEGFFKKETVFCVSGLAALLSAIFVHPTDAYSGYVDFEVLALLFCLMVVVSAIKDSGAFEVLSRELLNRGKTLRSISMTLVALSFFMSMLVTNDVALITLVPFTVMTLDHLDRRRLAVVIVMETIAANMGSMLTPVGNPQNLYLYSYYSLDVWEFMQITFPITLASFVIVILAAAAMPKQKLDVSFGDIATIKQKGLFYLYLGLFIVALASVVDIVDYRICLLLILSVTAAVKRSLLREVDYYLLMTFVFFFIFVGNLGEIGTISKFIAATIEGKELFSGILLSQVISNVPAAVMLSAFTENYRDLILGVDIGGLGTLTASLASLISYKIYSREKDAKPKEYIATFSVMNFGMLALLVATTLVL